MKVEIWRSYACNNSSHARLVARFSDANTASEMAAELEALFKKHGEEMDAAMEADGATPDEPTAAVTEIAKKHGFEWEDALTWGDEMLSGDEPQVLAEENVLVIHHTYCGGGFGDVHKILRARGATDIEMDESKPMLSALFRLPGGEKGVALATELRHQVGDAVKDGEVDDFTPPWGEYEQRGRAAFFCDGKTAGVYLPTCLPDVVALRDWLKARVVDERTTSIRLCEYRDQIRFETIAEARCTACKGELEYLDPRVHEIETEQLACASCGGMFDLAALMKSVPPAPKT